jgi:hypothetical protein
VLRKISGPKTDEATRHFRTYIAKTLVIFTINVVLLEGYDALFLRRDEKHVRNFYRNSFNNLNMEDWTITIRLILGSYVVGIGIERTEAQDSAVLKQMDPRTFGSRLIQIKIEYICSHFKYIFHYYRK